MKFVKSYDLVVLMDEITDMCREIEGKGRMGIKKYDSIDEIWEDIDRGKQFF